MTIETTIREIASSTNSLNTLLEMKLKARAALKIARMVNVVQPELQTYNETRQKIVEEYMETKEIEPEESDANPQEDGEALVENTPPPQQLVFKEGKKEEDLNKELTDLLDTEITLNINQLQSNLLDDIEIEPSKLVPLLWMFKDN